MTGGWRRRRGRCASGCQSFAYDLDERVGEDILPFLERFGKPVLPFGSTSLLKVRGPAFFITGIKHLKEIRLVADRGIDPETYLTELEEALTEWVGFRKGTVE